MVLTDPTRAREVLTRFLGLVRQIREPRDAWEGKFTDPREEPPPKEQWSTYYGYERWLTKTVIGMQPLVEDIARAIDPTRHANRFERDLIDGWDPVEEATLRLLGILDNAPERERILGPRGPVLAAGGLHRWVWNAAADLWDGGHYKQAVQEAWNAVEQQTQLKLDRADTSGKDLFAQAFTAKPGRRLRFVHIEQKTDDGMDIPDWTSAHEGAMYFGMGCAQGIRNLQVHSIEDLNEEEALEYLASLSVLARWVDTAKTISDPDA